jgi:putative membrane protein
MMVAGGHWVWEQPGAYFGVPLQNYWGWWLTTFVTFWLFLSLAGVNPQHDTSNDSFKQLAIWSFAANGLSSILVDFEIGLDGPALVGTFAMLPWVVLGWFSFYKTDSH